MSKHIRTWTEKHPLLYRLFKPILKQKVALKTIETIDAKFDSTPSLVTFAAIYESELQAIGLDSSQWDTETGGDLFGVWNDIPIIYLATRAGQKALRNNAHFRLDVDYLIKISSELSEI